MNLQIPVMNFAALLTDSFNPFFPKEIWMKEDNQSMRQ